MQAGESAAEVSVSKSKQIATALDQTLMAIDNISQMSMQTAQTVFEQTQVANNINENVVSIKTNAQENLDAVKLSSATAAETMLIIKKLDQLTSQFWQTQQET